MHHSTFHAACATLCSKIYQADVICFTDNEAVSSILVTGKSNVLMCRAYWMRFITRKA